MWKVKIFCDYDICDGSYKNLENKINNFIEEHHIYDFEVQSDLTKRGNYDTSVMIILKYKEGN